VTLDQRLTRSARHVVEGLTPPPVDVDAIRARARSNRRRTAFLASGAAVAAMIAVGATVVAGRDTAAPPPVEPGPTPNETVTSAPAPEDPNPFPTSMTPEEVVNHPRAQLRTVAVAPDDPDTRISMWIVQCERPCREGALTSFTGAAVTTDGYATTTFVRPLYGLGGDVHVSRPQDDVFLAVDPGNKGFDWMVDLDGTVREVTPVTSEISPTDPRLWFQCYGSWRQNWCALDPDNATSYTMPKAWDGSASSPLVADRPWGANPRPRATSSSGLLEAWWDTDSGRQLRTLAEAHAGDYIPGTPPGQMAHWARADGADSVDIYTSRNGGADWEVDTRDFPGFSEYTQISRSPDGAYLAYNIYPRLVVRRAEESGGAFRVVYEQPEGSGAETTGAGLWMQDDLVYATANATVAVSDDDGLTWTTIETWR
jgi:hypothetical protein